MGKKRKAPSEAIAEFLAYYDNCVAEYRFAFDCVGEEDKCLQDFLHEMEFAEGCEARNRIATRLQKSRRERRASKNIVRENERLVKFFEEPANRKCLNQMRQLLGQQRKEEEYLKGSKVYKLRSGTGTIKDPVTPVTPKNAMV